MRKYLWWGTAVCVLAFAITFQHENYVKNAAGVDRYGISLAVAAPDSPKAEDNSQQAGEPTWAYLLYLALGWPGGVTVWALFITMIAIAEQSHFTRIAAEATNRSIDVNKTKQRAKLELGIDRLQPIDGHKPQVNMRITNVGESTARITRAVAALDITPFGGTVEGSARDLLVSENSLKADASSFETVFYIKSLGRYPDGSATGQWDVHLIGDIRFTDAFDDHWRLPIHYIWRVYPTTLYGFPEGGRKGEWENQKPNSEYKTDGHQKNSLWRWLQSNPMQRSPPSYSLDSDSGQNPD